MTATVLAADARARTRERFLERAGRALAKREQDKARSLAQAFLEKHPRSSEAQFVIALASLLDDDLAAAAALSRDAFDADPHVGEAADLAAVVHGLAGDVINAIYYGKLAAALPSSGQLAALLPPSLPTLARVLCEISEQPLLQRGLRALGAGDWILAEHWLRQHLAFEPECRDAYVGLGLAVLSQGRPRAAIDLLRAARHVFPRDAGLASLLGRALSAFGRFAEAAACNGRALALAPEDAAVHAAALIDRLADPQFAPANAAAGFRAWGRKFALGGSREPPRVPDRSTARLAIGLLIAGEAGSAAVTALTHVLMHRNRERFVVVGFGHGSLGETGNAALQKGVDRWHDVADSDPLTLAATVYAEGIDILVDLAGFAAPHLLAAFGRRMTPCQVGWMNTPYGTGLAAMDYLLTDRFVDADPSSAELCRERLAYLHLGCVPALPEAPPDATPRPQGEMGVTFAADATLADLDAGTVACWAELLDRVPGSKLLLRDHDFRDPETLAEVIGRFGNHGHADRIDVLAAPQAGALFAEADIALLPLASPQPETVLAALRAGVPVVCLAGDGRHRRFAASLLHHLGLGAETIAESLEQYVSQGVRWAEADDLRAVFRTTLGERLTRSEAGEARARARDLEAAFEDMWRETCARQDGIPPLTEEGEWNE